jgi:putative ABC transport system ATP-binding protein
MIKVDTIIKAEGICRDFVVGSQVIHALKDISIEIEKGSVTILRGRSGSGKTTLINILGIIDAPTKGEILINGKKVSKMNDLEKNNLRQNKFGYSFQAGALIPNMTVYENVELVLRLNNVPFSERKVRTLECIEKVGLIKKANRYVEELSGGEAQRIGIARAMVHKPEIIFADEPTSALDYNTGCYIIKLFKELSVSYGCTLVITTHDPKLLPAADCVLNLMDGEIINE